MKKLIPLAVIGALLAGCQQSTETKTDANAEAKTQPASTAVELKTDIAKQSYAIGAMSAQRISSDEMLKKMNIDFELMAKGFADGLNGNPQLTEAQVQEQLMAFQGAIQAKMQEEQSAKVQPEKDKGAAHIAQLKAEDDSIKATESGLHYKVISTGDSDNKPKATDVVKVHYTGTLIDGTQFDSSVERGEPIDFPLNRVIKGWTEGVQLMSVGDKYRFYIPSDLGYGDRGMPPSIPGGATLIFDVELLNIESTQEAAEKEGDSEVQ